MDLVLESIGLLPHSVVQETRRWEGIPDVGISDPPIRTLQEAIGILEAIHMAEEELYGMESYPTIAHELRGNWKKGCIHLRLEDGSDLVEDMYYAVIRGKVWMHWVAEEFSDQLVAVDSYLLADSFRWYFHTVETFYSGRSPQWIRATISTKEPHVGL